MCGGGGWGVGEREEGGRKEERERAGARARASDRGRAIERASEGERERDGGVCVCVCTYPAPSSAPAPRYHLPPHGGWLLSRPRRTAAQTMWGIAESTSVCSSHAQLRVPHSFHRITDSQRQRLQRPGGASAYRRGRARERDPPHRRKRGLIRDRLLRPADPPAQTLVDSQFCGRGAARSRRGLQTPGGDPNRAAGQAAHMRRTKKSEARAMFASSLQM